MSDPNEQYTIASYNMSFASDQGLFGEEAKKSKVSEGSFLTRATIAREFWVNAFNHLKKFIEEKKPAAIGLQEMLTNGIGIIEKDVSFNNYSKVTNTEVSEKSAELLSYSLTLWDTERLGDMLYEYKSFFNNDKGTPQSGRIITIIFTKKGFILINLHSYQLTDKKDSSNLRAEIQRHFKTALEEVEVKDKDKDFIINPSKIFVMGDFNDQEHTINNDNKLELTYDDNNTVNLTTGRDSSDKIFSCCYNWDSVDLEFTILKDKYNTNRVFDKKDNESVKDFIERHKKPPKMALPLKYGAIKNYKNTGDYCLGKISVEPLTIYPSPFLDEVGASKASDHELVYATFRVETKVIESSHGGKKRRIKNKSKNKQSKNIKKRTKRKRKSKNKNKHTHKRKSI